MTVAAFVGYAVDSAGAGIWAAMLAGGAAGAVLSMLISRMIFAPFLRRGTSRFTMVMVSLALGVIMQNAIQAVAGVSFRSFPQAPGTSLGLAGVVLALNLATFDFTFGNAFLLIIVAAAVFGSVGEPYGAMVGAVVIGMTSEIAAIWIPELKQVVAFVILVAILLLRPSGLWRRGFVGMSVAAR